MGRPVQEDIAFMKKLIFDKDLYLMGIGMADGKIYKKLGYFWSENSWDTENVGPDTIGPRFRFTEMCVCPRAKPVAGEDSSFAICYVAMNMLTPSLI